MWFADHKRSTGDGYLRRASPYERRCIEREALGFYGALVVGAIYEFESSSQGECDSILSYTDALRKCIDRHPQLSSVARGAGTGSPYYELCPVLDLCQHIEILHSSDNQELHQELPRIMNASWLPSTPAWKVVVMPTAAQRCFVAFSYSHALGDGMSGMAFHRTFLDALQDEPQSKEQSLAYASPTQQMPEPFDTAKNLPISWSFLLSPLLGAFLPKWLASIFGLRASVSKVTAGTWTGSPVFYDPEKYRTDVEVSRVDAGVVADVLKACRNHGVKLTGLLHYLIVAAMSESLAGTKSIDNLAATTAVNMRGAVGVSMDVMGNFVSGDFAIHTIRDVSKEGRMGVDWEMPKSITAQLAKTATTLQDQPIGLLRYLKSMRGWILSQVGGRREASYEVSNLTNFQAWEPTRRCSVTEMIFCQPADVASPPLKFNLVSVTNGPMNLAISWQAGALGLGPAHDEREFVRAIGRNIRSNLAYVASDEQ